MPTIVIAGTVIDFPNTSASPNWAPAIVEFAEVVEAALSNVIGTYDVVPQQFILDSVPNGVDTALTNLSFSTTEVRSAQINYAVYRNTSTTTVSEAGVLNIVYDEAGASGDKWHITRESVSNAEVSFIIDDDGQVYINTDALSGINYNGFVDYRATALQNTY